MNIFILDFCPKKAATYYNDIHSSKIIVELGQMLANSYPKEDLLKAPKTQTGNIRRYSYFNNPCSKWVRRCSSNWWWTIRHGLALCNEFEYRREKKHFTEEFIQWCNMNPPLLSTEKQTPFYLGMPDKYKVDCPVQSYRNYYMGDKRHLAKWTKREVPSWWR